VVADWPEGFLDGPVAMTAPVALGAADQKSESVAEFYLILDDGDTDRAAAGLGF